MEDLMWTLGSILSKFISRVVTVSWSLILINIKHIVVAIKALCPCFHCRLKSKISSVEWFPIVHFYSFLKKLLSLHLVPRSHSELQSDHSPHSDSEQSTSEVITSSTSSTSSSRLSEAAGDSSFSLANWGDGGDGDVPTELSKMVKLVRWLLPTQQIFIFSHELHFGVLLN